MKVWILTGDTVTDVAGELLEDGKVIGVYASYALAEEALADIVSGKVIDTYWRKERDYDIEVYEVNS